MLKLLIQILKLFAAKREEPQKTVLTVRNYIGDKFPTYRKEWTEEHETNAKILLNRVYRILLEIKCSEPKINSGWRPLSYNKKIGGAKKSNHISAQAIDIADWNKALANKITKEMLEKFELWIEDPNHTKTWVHFQSMPPRSGRRIFKP